MTDPRRFVERHEIRGVAAGTSLSVLPQALGIGPAMSAFHLFAQGAPLHLFWSGIQRVAMIGADREAYGFGEAMARDGFVYFAGNEDEPQGWRLCWDPFGPAHLEMGEEVGIGPRGLPRLAQPGDVVFGVIGPPDDRITNLLCRKALNSYGNDRLAPFMVFNQDGPNACMVECAMKPRGEAQYRVAPSGTAGVTARVKSMSLGGDVTYSPPGPKLLDKQYVVPTLDALFRYARGESTPVGGAAPAVVVGGNSSSSWSDIG